jgi:hypothetical protein
VDIQRLKDNDNQVKIKNRKYIMKIKISWLIIVLLLAIDILLYGPGLFRILIPHPQKSRHTITEFDPNSEAFVKSILPQVNMMCDQTRELSAENRWLKRSFDKCIEKLEAERGLEPIPIKPLFDFDRHLKNYDTNHTAKISNKMNEPFFTPYKIPVSEPIELRRNDVDNIARVRALMGLRIMAVQMAMYSENNRMINFEERLKRLDANQPSQERSE